MASGSYGNGAGGGCALKISWSSSAGTGGSTVSASLIAQNQNGYYWYARVYAYGITINGSQVTGSNAALSSTANGSSTLISHSVWVGYTGNKSITISGYANFGSAGVSGLSNQSISGTATLDKVGSAPSMGTITAPTTGTWSETTASITVSWNAGSSYNNSGVYRIDVSVNGGAYTFVSGDLSWSTRSWTYNITPSQGTTYQFRISCGNDVGWSGHQYSGVVTLNKLNAPSINDIGTYNPYTSSTLTVGLSGGSQTNGGNFVRMCDLYYGSTWLCSCKSYDNTSWGNTSQTITYAAASYASRIGTGAYSSGSFRIVAWIENANRSRSGYVEKYFTVNLNSDGGATPTLGAFTLSGGAFSNPTTCFIAGVTNVGVSSPDAGLRRAPSGTTVSYTVSCTGVSSKSGQNVTFSGLSAGVKTITVTARDSRGLGTSVSKQIKVQSYSAPVIRNYSVTRDATTQTNAKITYTLSYSPIYKYADINTAGDQLNGINTQQYSKDNSTWANVTNGTTITGLSTESVYNIYLRISDKVRTTTYTTASYKVPTIKTNVAIRKGGIGINCVPQSSYALDVSGAGHVSGLMNVDGNLNGNSQLNIAGDTTLKGTLTVNKDIWQTPNSSNVSNLGGVPIAGTIDKMTLGDIRNYKSGMYTSVCDGDWKYIWVNKHRNGASDGNNYNMYFMQSFWNDVLYYGRVNSSGTVQSKYRVMTTSDILGSLFPVGAIYLTYNNNNPQNFLGGTWTQFGQGRVLIGQGTGNDGNTSMTFTTGGGTGGTYFPVNQLGVTAPGYGGIGGGNNYYSSRVMAVQLGKENNLTVLKTLDQYGYSGSQPYVTVYFWRRTA